ncbi:MAG: manganese efflux pump MntP family protein [Prevotellaceae bacterium]|jgi:putative Mn2+ efflux pump MntP|nr:manganese efflux pump MntP family protein [Prevotellaceae bacterium]
MSFLSLLLLALGLCFDTFAVSLSGSAGRTHTAGRITKIAITLAAAQTAMLFTGWLLGTSISAYIAAFDHWIAFVLLAFIGGKMIWESSEKEAAHTTNLQNPRILLIVALATSIDALAVGVSLALLNLSRSGLFTECGLVFAITATVAAAGLMGGSYLGKRIGARSELLGGIILIAIGAKIVLEHLHVI